MDVAIDAVVSAGKVFARHAPVLLPLVLVLQATKALVLLGLIGALGEDVGATVGFVSCAVLLAFTDAVSARLAADVHHGDAPRSPLQLVRRTLPIMPVALALGLLTVLTLIRVPFNAQWLVIPGTAMYVAALDARRRADQLDFEGAASEALRRSSAFLIPVLVLGALSLFSTELIPALTDSAIGRKAPLSQWIPIEAVISSLITPIVVMAAATLYLRAGDADDASAVATPSTGPGPLMPDRPPVA